MKFNQEIKIENHTVSGDSPVFIIAEAGVNHNGSLELAKKMVDVAVESGADAVKFQAFRTENLILNDVEKANYQKRTTGTDESQFEMLKKLEIDQETNRVLKSYCTEKDIVFMTTPFDEQSLEELDELDMAAYKVSSTDTVNLPFLKKIAMKKKPIILSTGMTYLAEVALALKEIESINQDVILLHCTSNYPMAMEEANLRVINNYQSEFGIIPGYSDHSEGIGVSPYAVAMGAKVVEKHFTLDKTMEGPDQEASLDPKELKQFVDEIRKVETCLGQPIKTVTESEQGTRKSLQKCLVARTAIQEGEPFSDENIVAMRTGGVGVSPINWGEIEGKPSRRSFKKNEVIEL